MRRSCGLPRRHARGHTPGTRGSMDAPRYSLADTDLPLTSNVLWRAPAEFEKRDVRKEGLRLHFGSSGVGDIAGERQRWKVRRGSVEQIQFGDRKGELWVMWGSMTVAEGFKFN
ncbi:hypothetical protein AAFF_G00238000 [Aldrovandia affinis]|uniref:Uncharacterized protein n=1 Tax=Aldrovandia affinis TaxID=143900 RepID=A0AAD7REM9_9TELE|nr:hypothetical protein AAFF_G00238000 [Aldrovandia affinis]